MNTLFICRYNRFRSVLAEAFFKKLNKNKKNKVKSAGLIKGSPISEETKEIAKGYNLKIKKNPEAISSQILIWQDIIIITADNVQPIIFKNQKNVKKLTLWKIKDSNNYTKSYEIAKIIKNKIEKFIEELSWE